MKSFKKLVSRSSKISSTDQPGEDVANFPIRSLRTLASLTMMRSESRQSTRSRGDFRFPKDPAKVTSCIHADIPTDAPEETDDSMEVRYWLWRVLTAEIFQCALKYPQWVIETCNNWEGTGKDLLNYKSSYDRICPANALYFDASSRKSNIEFFAPPTARAAIGAAISYALRNKSNRNFASEVVGNTNSAHEVSDNDQEKSIPAASKRSPTSAAPSVISLRDVGVRAQKSATSQPSYHASANASKAPGTLQAESTQHRTLPRRLSRAAITQQSALAAARGIPQPMYELEGSAGTQSSLNLSKMIKKYSFISSSATPSSAAASIDDRSTTSSTIQESTPNTTPGTSGGSDEGSDPDDNNLFSGAKVKEDDVSKAMRQRNPDVHKSEVQKKPSPPINHTDRVGRAVSPPPAPPCSVIDVPSNRFVSQVSQHPSQGQQELPRRSNSRYVRSPLVKSMPIRSAPDLSSLQPGRAMSQVQGETSNQMSHLQHNEQHGELKDSLSHSIRNAQGLGPRNSQPVSHVAQQVHHVEQSPAQQFVPTTPATWYRSSSTPMKRSCSMSGTRSASFAPVSRSAYYSSESTTIAGEGTQPSTTANAQVPDGHVMPRPNSAQILRSTNPLRPFSPVASTAPESQSMYNQPMQGQTDSQTIESASSTYTRQTLPHDTKNLIKVKFNSGLPPGTGWKGGSPQTVLLPRGERNTAADDHAYAQATHLQFKNRRLKQQNALNNQAAQRHALQRSASVNSNFSRQNSTETLRARSVSPPPNTFTPSAFSLLTIPTSSEPYVLKPEKPIPRLIDPVTGKPRPTLFEILEEKEGLDGKAPRERNDLRYQ